MFIIDTDGRFRVTIGGSENAWRVSAAVFPQSIREHFIQHVIAVVAANGNAVNPDKELIPSMLKKRSNQAELRVSCTKRISRSS